MTGPCSRRFSNQGFEDLNLTDKLLSVAEVADWLGMSRAWVRDHETPESLFTSRITERLQIAVIYKLAEAVSH
jgi:hypothetical protein